MHFLRKPKTEDLDYCCKNNLSPCVRKIGKINSFPDDVSPCELTIQDIFLGVRKLNYGKW